LEVGKWALKLKSIHVAIPLNISTFHKEKGNHLEIFLKNMANQLLQKLAISHVPRQLEIQDYGNSVDFQK
jgi:hypothetical protein